MPPRRAGLHTRQAVDVYAAAPRMKKVPERIPLAGAAKPPKMAATPEEPDLVGIRLRDRGVPIG